MPGTLPSLEGQSLKSACCCFCGSQSSEPVKIPISAVHACCSYALKEDPKEQSNTSFSNQLFGCSQKMLVKFKRRETAKPSTLLGLPHFKAVQKDQQKPKILAARAARHFPLSRDGALVGKCPEKATVISLEIWVQPHESHLLFQFGAEVWMASQ